MYTDLLPRIKNASAAHHVSFLAPFSKVDLSIAKVLMEEGYLKSAEKKTVDRKHYIEIVLKYDDKKEPIFSNFALKSTAGRHVYKKYSELRPIKQGFGIGIISTSKGITT